MLKNSQELINVIIKQLHLNHIINESSNMISEEM